MAFSLGGIAKGAVDGYQQAETFKMRREGFELDKLDREQRRQLIEQQIASGQRQAGREQQVDGINQEMLGTPARDLAGPLPPGVEDRAEAGLRAPATPGLSGPGLYGALQRKAMLTENSDAVLKIDQAKRAQELRDATAEGVRRAQDPEFVPQQLPGMWSSHKAVSVSKPDAKGFSYVTVGDQPPVKLSGVQMQRLAVAQTLTERGFGSEAMQYLDGIDSTLAKQVGDANDLLLKVGKENNDATGHKNTALYQDGMVRYHMGQLGIEGQKLGLERQRLANDQDRGKLGQIQYFEVKDPTTGAVNVEGRIPTFTAKGGLAWQPVPVPGKPYSPKQEGVKFGPNGEIVQAGTVFVPNKQGKYVEAPGLKPSRLDLSMAADATGYFDVGKTGFVSARIAIRWRCAAHS